MRECRFAPVLALVAGLLAACGNPAAMPSGAVPTTTAQVIRTDIVSRLRLDGTLTYAGSYTVINEAGPGVYTALPSPGAVVARGQVLYRVNGRPIPLFYGDPEWRSLGVGVSAGADVKSLELNLLALGFGRNLPLIANGQFGAIDAAAVRRWQASLGMAQTGTVALGDAVYAAGPIRVAAVQPTPGMFAQPGQPAIDATTSQHIVLAPLDVSRQSSVKAGDAVIVDLPDGKTSLPGSIAGISPVATAGINGQPATVTLTITLADASGGGSLDQAPVAVEVTDTVHSGVLAVPVMALLAEPGGLYAVVVVEGAQRRTVAVTTGLFDDRGLVEVGSPDLREGMSVEVPQS